MSDEYVLPETELLTFKFRGSDGSPQKFSLDVCDAFNLYLNFKTQYKNSPDVNQVTQDHFVTEKFKEHILTKHAHTLTTSAAAYVVSVVVLRGTALKKKLVTSLTSSILSDATLTNSPPSNEKRSRCSSKKPKPKRNGKRG